MVRPKEFAVPILGVQRVALENIAAKQGLPAVVSVETLTCAGITRRCIGDQENPVTNMVESNAGETRLSSEPECGLMLTVSKGLKAILGKCANSQACNFAGDLPEATAAHLSKRILDASERSQPIS